MVKDIVLTTINAKWIHPSLALRLLKANLGALEENCEIIELALRQTLAEKIEPLFAASPRILGVSVSIWNHAATVELLAELEKAWAAQGAKPVVVLGGPEVSYLPPSPAETEIFSFADYVIRGEGEEAFKKLCEEILAAERPAQVRPPRQSPEFINAENVDVGKIKSGYRLYTDEDLAKKLVYVEASRGCPFNCEFCLSAVKDVDAACPTVGEKPGRVREFPLELFLAEMDGLVRRGAKTFKFLDRTFNLNIERAVRICEFFLEKIEQRKGQGLVVHFEMVPSLFPSELREVLSRFPPGTLRLEIGIQTLNSEVAARIGRPSNAEKELETLRFLREKTNAIIHADLIAGLPGEDLESFAAGFDRLWGALSETGKTPAARHSRAEIQLGILKLLPGAPIRQHNDAFGMRYNPAPPYEIEETAVLSAVDLARIKNFARFWELLVNRRLVNSVRLQENGGVFEKFMALSDSLYARFGRNWGIGRDELLKVVENLAEFG